MSIDTLELINQGLRQLASHPLLREPFHTRQRGVRFLQHNYVFALQLEKVLERRVALSDTQSHRAAPRIAQEHLRIQSQMVQQLKRQLLDIGFAYQDLNRLHSGPATTALFNHLNQLLQQKDVETAQLLVLQGIESCVQLICAEVSPYLDAVSLDSEAFEERHQLSDELLFFGLNAPQTPEYLDSLEQFYCAMPAMLDEWMQAEASLRPKSKIRRAAPHLSSPVQPTSAI